MTNALAGGLTAKERRVLSSNHWGVSAIVLWDLAKLAQLGRVDVDLEDPEIVRALSRLHVWDLDLRVCRQSTQLDFRADPADELIAATSIVHHAPLVTRDRKIKQSKLVRFA